MTPAITISKETFDYVIAALEFAQKNLPFQSVLVQDAIGAAKEVQPNLKDRYDEAACLESEKRWEVQPQAQYPDQWATFLHYPDCWDTAAYPTLHSAIHEALAWSGCSVCKAQAQGEAP